MEMERMTRARCPISGFFPFSAPLCLAAFAAFTTTSLLPPVLGESVVEAVEPSVLHLPRWLSCNGTDWTGLSSTLSATSLLPWDESKDPFPGLPRICTHLDEDLVMWMMGDLLLPNWPVPGTEDVWEKIRKLQYRCGQDVVGLQETEVSCVDPPGEESLCLYGLVSAEACMSVMFARYPDALASLWHTALLSAKMLRWLLHSERKMLEFLDSSGWPFSLEDIGNIVHVYADALTEFEDSSPDEPGVRIAAYLRPAIRPWSLDSESGRSAAAAARASLAMVASWRWQPSLRGSCPPDPKEAAARSIRIWAFGTHCSVMAEPVASIAILMPEEFQLDVAWHGTADYCGHHSGDWPIVKADHGPMRQLYEKHWTSTSKNVDGHKDSLQDLEGFLQAFQNMLADDADFQKADLALCSEPAIACLPMHRAGRPVIGYFGVHIAFMVDGYDSQVALYSGFTELAKDPRNTLATKSPYISWQLYGHLPLKIPAIMPLSLYTQPALYSGTLAQGVLLNKRPVHFWDRRLMLETIARHNNFDWIFFDANELRGARYQHWCSYRAGVYFPYDWLQTMAFFDWVNMGIPTFVPDTPMFTFTHQGTNSKTAWPATMWRPPREVFGYQYSDWNDLEGRVFWWQLTDFKSLPGVQVFTSVAQLFQGLASQERLWEVSGQLRQAHLVRTVSAADFWRQAILRALSR
ncbi:unnamed protein product [Polarella glacialis]|uniref:Uncharacterized protein n=1 Tax=Polarella glacialis TaxID=89957 RepID=A0A813FJN3_POLGL|nr:unnamed protein product [Polarella glacialis]